MNVVAAHLARALEQHRRWCQANGYTPPAELDQLLNIVTGGQAQTESLDEREVAHAGPVLALTYADAGRLLGVSARTVARLVADEKLRAVSVGGSKRVPRSEVERLIADQLNPKETL